VYTLYIHHLGIGRHTALYIHHPGYREAYHPGIYTTLYTLGIPSIPPYPAVRYTCSVLAAVPAVGALGSKREKPMGEASLSLSGS